MEERKYRPGQIVKHKLTTDKVIVVRNALADPTEIRYQVRCRDYSILEVREEELDDTY